MAIISNSVLFVTEKESCNMIYYLHQLNLWWLLTSGALWYSTNRYSSKASSKWLHVIQK